MNPLLKFVFDLLQQWTTRAGLRGNRTALGLVGALGLLVYALTTGDYVQGVTALSLLLVTIGLKPEDPPQEPPMQTT